jgi:lambda family phage minor tail protein L
VASVSYQRYPVVASEFEWDGQGTLSHLHFAAWKVAETISAMRRASSDLAGCPSIRERTLTRYLETRRFPNGNSFANPKELFPDDVFRVNRGDGSVASDHRSPTFTKILRATRNRARAANVCSPASCVSATAVCRTADSPVRVNTAERGLSVEYRIGRVRILRDPFLRLYL